MFHTNSYMLTSPFTHSTIYNLHFTSPKPCSTTPSSTSRFRIFPRQHSYIYTYILTFFSTANPTNKSIAPQMGPRIQTRRCRPILLPLRSSAGIISRRKSRRQRRRKGRKGRKKQDESQETHSLYPLAGAARRYRDQAKDAGRRTLGYT